MQIDKAKIQGDFKSNFTIGNFFCFLAFAVVAGGVFWAIRKFKPAAKALDKLPGKPL